MVVLYSSHVEGIGVQDIVVEGAVVFSSFREMSCANAVQVAAHLNKVGSGPSQRSLACVKLKVGISRTGGEGEAGGDNSGMIAGPDPADCVRSLAVVVSYFPRF